MLVTKYTQIKTQFEENKHWSLSDVSKALVTRNICVNINFYVVLIETQTQMQRNGFEPILCIWACVTIN